MHATQVERLATAAREGGAERDGLAVDHGDDGFRFSIPAEGVDEDGLTEADLDRLAREYPDYVTNFAVWTRDRAAADAAFLRWAERADELSVPERYDRLREGAARTWGEVRVAVLLDEDGERRYDLRHEDDAGVPTGDLDRYDDPLDARSLVKTDDDGRYRPLKAAPSLPHGWVFPDLDGRAAAETVEYVYPATIANWHLENEGELDVDHWRETMERQSGIYGVVKTWDRGEGHEHVNWVAEACCDDSQCLKRREWQYDEKTDLDVDGGDGVFPCREPCSLVVSAARKWTRLEAETERTYEFTLTPSEKEQVEAVIDAVADGRTRDIREADVKDPANRYRTRFLRAKRFDGAGNLSGTPTDEE
ncbi:DR2241 family protein [Halosegnis marinus]|uniref:DR2241 family protein n=1 Tax=Halosegnis marinus TaxID=3034023 RepID=A0ABD5ZRM1_9EURY|nr:DR2241 family protein [Halosegnis sp. DT85]